MARRKRKNKQKPKVLPTPTDGVWIKAHMDGNGAVTWKSNFPNQQSSNTSLGGSVLFIFNKLGINASKRDGFIVHEKIRDFKGAYAAALKSFNSRSHRRKFGVWFKVSTAPIERAYVVWKLAQGGQP